MWKHFLMASVFVGAGLLVYDRLGIITRVNGLMNSLLYGAKDNPRPAGKK